MQLTDPNNPNERKKLIVASVLGVVAILVLGYIFFGGSSSKPTPNRNARASASPTPTKGPPPPDTLDDPSTYQPIKYNPYVPAITEASRNIFAFYEPPPPTPKPVFIPTPTPTHWGSTTLSVFAGQALVLLGGVLAEPASGGLWPLGLLFLGFYSILALFGTGVGATLRRLQTRRKGSRTG